MSFSAFPFVCFFFFFSIVFTSQLRSNRQSTALSCISHCFSLLTALFSLIISLRFSFVFRSFTLLVFLLAAAWCTLGPYLPLPRPASNCLGSPPPLLACTHHPPIQPQRVCCSAARGERCQSVSIVSFFNSQVTSFVFFFRSSLRQSQRWILDLSLAPLPTRCPTFFWCGHWRRKKVRAAIRTSGPSPSPFDGAHSLSCFSCRRIFNSDGLLNTWSLDGSRLRARGRKGSVEIDRIDSVAGRMMTVV